jgi:hypothetical protein
MLNQNSNHKAFSSVIFLTYSAILFIASSCSASTGFDSIDSSFTGSSFTGTICIGSIVLPVSATGSTTGLSMTGS